MPDWLIAVPLVLGLVGFFIKKRMWRWVGLFGGIAAYELILGLTGQTLSQEAWAHFGWDVVVMLGGYGALLLMHLAWKRLKPRLTPKP